jgi:hypothetical protein
VKPNTFLAAAENRLKKRTRGSGSCLEWVTCTPEDGQLARNMQCTCAIKRRRVNHNRGCTWTGKRTRKPDIYSATACCNIVWVHLAKSTSYENAHYAGFSSSFGPNTLRQRQRPSWAITEPEVDAMGLYRSLISTTTREAYASNGHAYSTDIASAS